MALLEEGGDEGLFDEMLLAAVDAAVSRRIGRPVQHPPPQKKLMITHVSSPSTSRHDSEILKPKVAQMTSGEQRFQSYHREMRSTPPTPPPSVGARDIKPLQYRKHNGEAGQNEDVKLLKNSNAIWSSGSSHDHHARQEGFARGSHCNLSVAAAARPLQELQPWVGSRGLVERPPSSTIWFPAEETSPSKNCACSRLPGMGDVAIFKERQNAAMRTLVPGDYTMFHGKMFIKKAGWRKIAFFFNISFEIKDKTIKFDPQSNAVMRAEFVVRASMPSGRFTESWGSCDRSEKKFNNPSHDIPSTAETRAKNRACQDLLGIGEYKSE